MKNLFHPGQDVVCIHDDWYIKPPVPNLPVPRKNEIYTVDETESFDGKCYVSLRQFQPRCWFNQNGFAPVMPHDQLEKELLAIFQPITII